MASWEPWALTRQPCRRGGARGGLLSTQRAAARGSGQASQPPNAPPSNPPPHPPCAGHLLSERDNRHLPAVLRQIVQRSLRGGGRAGGQLRRLIL